MSLESLQAQAGHASSLPTSYAPPARYRVLREILACRLTILGGCGQHSSHDVIKEGLAIVESHVKRQGLTRTEPVNTRACFLSL